MTTATPRTTPRKKIIYILPSNFVACENSRPSSLPARVAFRETPLGSGAKKDGCFRRLRISQMPRSIQYVYRSPELAQYVICNASVQFQYENISRRRSRSSKYPELGHFTL